jgi:hypothetical protein
VKPNKERQIRRGLAAEFLFEVFTGIYAIAVVVMCWRKPAWLSLLLGGGLLIQLWFWREKADLAMMAAAALLGTPSEMLCVRLGVWTYHAPGLVFGIPVWIPLAWAFLFCLFRRISLSIHSVRRRIWRNREMLSVKILFGVLCGVIVVYYLITVSLIMRTIAIVYTAFMIPAVIFWHGERDILIFIIGGILGTVGEYICMKLGFWHYHYPLLRSIGLPISLPLAWGLSSVITGRVAKIWEKGSGVEP